ncbi:MAG: LysM peptidoglycan-binding domain-containing protein [Anaerolineaceae bacterium]|nr:LysM peptidoglycan-binding domain-containing protein [Anaerolineaceae bacterium]
MKHTQLQKQMISIFLLAICFFLLQSDLSAQDESIEDAQPAEGLTLHVVQRGENLYRIAIAYGTTIDELAELNGITNVSSIFVGQRLLVPSGEDPSVPQTHTVQVGETLASIADLYDLEWQYLLELNQLANADRIYPGQVIALVPEAVTTPTPEPTPSNEPSPEPATEEPETPVSQEDTSLGIVATPEAPAVTGIPFLHTVQRGETLYKIATAYGLTVNDLVTANDISDPTLIYGGQQLIIPNLEVPETAINLPAPLTNVQVNPILFREGETGSFIITTSAPATVTGTFLGTDLKIVSQDALQHSAIIGIPMNTVAGIYPIELFVNGAAQTTYTFNVRVVAGGYGAQYITLAADQAPLYDIAVDENEMNLLSRITSEFTEPRQYGGTLSLPAAAAMNAPFGARRSINGGGFDRYHSGADFASPPGTNVFAAAPGRIVMADTLNIRGNAVVIDHGWGVYTLYAHMSSILVSLGDTVQTGQVIGLAGTTGRSTGPHLHWEVWVHGVPVNPLQWLQSALP